MLNAVSPIRIKQPQAHFGAYYNPTVRIGPHKTPMTIQLGEWAKGWERWEPLSWVSDKHIGNYMFTSVNPFRRGDLLSIQCRPKTPEVDTLTKFIEQEFRPGRRGDERGDVTMRKSSEQIIFSRMGRGGVETPTQLIRLLSMPNAFVTIRYITRFSMRPDDRESWVNKLEQINFIEG